jgi:hypothetical protein
MVVSVRARDFWTDTGFDFEVDGVYMCEAAGRWRDCVVPTGPDGYDSLLVTQRRLENQRRLPTAKWFALCGVVSGPGNMPFLIGSSRQIQPTAGRLMCFANDAPRWYWNNSGHVVLTVTRIR